MFPIIAMDSRRARYATALVCKVPAPDEIRPPLCRFRIHYSLLPPLVYSAVQGRLGRAGNPRTDLCFRYCALNRWFTTYGRVRLIYNPICFSSPRNGMSERLEARDVIGIFFIPSPWAYFMYVFIYFLFFFFNAPVALITSLRYAVHHDDKNNVRDFRRLKCQVSRRDVFWWIHICLSGIFFFFFLCWFVTVEHRV